MCTKEKYKVLLAFKLNRCLVLKAIFHLQVITAAKTVAAYPGSKIAQENLEVFADMYQWLVSDVTTVVKEVLETSHCRPDKQVYLSLPRPGVCTSRKYVINCIHQLPFAETWYYI